MSFFLLIPWREPHEDYLDDAISQEFGVEHMRLHGLSPLDLAVSKNYLFCWQLQRRYFKSDESSLGTSEEIEQRAARAFGSYVGGLAMLRLDLPDALAADSPS